MISKLSEAISLAALAHDGQTDKNGEPYILHVLRVMLAQTDDEARIVAVLHDLIEDTEWTISQLEKLGFAPGIITAIDVLTRHEEDEYLDGYVQRVIEGGSLCRKVKLADLKDNMRPVYLESFPTTARRMSLYKAAIRRLMAADHDHSLEDLPSLFGEAA